MLNPMLLFSILYFDFNRYSKWNDFEGFLEMKTSLVTSSL